MAFKAYSIIDIFSRKLVGHRVEDREADHLAVEMFTAAFAAHGAPQVVHADSGPAMRSTALADLLGPLGVTQTHNRPRVSNDNPFSESEFRTMKYRPNYPGAFDSLDQARAHVDAYVPWYNANHKHSGIALFSPDGSTTAPGGSAGPNAHTSTAPTTTPTPNGSAGPRAHPPRPGTSESTCPRNARKNSNDSRQVDNARFHQSFKQLTPFCRAPAGATRSATEIV
ncbi:transposase [Xylanimonas allomyrinae]|uniref:Transposase n=1 Tax=Xylanimonas allomyrinae TaxID=2509459 RepID=A0A4P6ER85_9MICO|nr:integrase core domain-containing protein [Xylanimonas allomyrinae]QAY62867.1 transposase [Xylanimonas allomyrinae]